MSQPAELSSRAPSEPCPARADGVHHFNTWWRDELRFRTEMRCGCGLRASLADEQLVEMTHAPTTPPPPPHDNDLTGVCAHCSLAIEDSRPGAVHMAGRNAGLQSCDTDASGLPYGFRAHPRGTPCPPHCLGSGPQRVNPRVGW